MSITFKCEHCDKKVEAPDAAGGKRGKCPYCKQSCYIPAPVADEDVLDLAPEDETEERRRAAQEQALREKERELIADLSRDSSADVPLQHRQDLTSQDVEHLIVNYCLELHGSRLEQAELHLAEMKKVRRTVSAAVDEFVTGKIKEPALAKIPPRLLAAFLAQLKEQLKT